MFSFALETMYFINVEKKDVGLSHNVARNNDGPIKPVVPAESVNCQPTCLGRTMH